MSDKCLRELFPTARGHPIQGYGSLEDLLAFAPQVKEKLDHFGAKLAAVVDGTFVAGPIKTKEQCEKKIATEYFGEETLLCDVVRGKLVVNTVEQVRQLQDFLNPETDPAPLLTEHWFCVSVLADYFADPKFETGYRCLNAKLAVRLNETEYYVVELQVVHEAFEEIYDKTHDYMAGARAVGEQYPDTVIPEEAALEMHLKYIACKALNAYTAKRTGLDILLQNPRKGFDSKFEDKITYGVLEGFGDEVLFLKITQVPISFSLSEIEQHLLATVSVEYWDFEESKWVIDNTLEREMSNYNLNIYEDEAAFYKAIGLEAFEQHLRSEGSKTYDLQPS